jgi:hypothetical protein
MDVANINEMAAAFVKFGQFIPAVAGAFAGLSAIALFAGARIIHVKDPRAKFLCDPEAAQPKYLLAFNQLEESQDPDLATSTRVVSDPTRPAMNMCVEAFAVSIQTNRTGGKDRSADKPTDNKQP